MTGEFEGKVAVATGASRGIGKGIALELAKDGADVAVIFRTEEEKAEEVVKAIGTMGRKAVAIRCDVSKESEVLVMRDKVLENFGKVDFLINNAGIHQHLKSWELTEKDWRRVMDVNITGTYLVARAFIPHMMERKSGKIVNISSCVAFTGTDHEVHYAASKGAVFSLTKSLALELAPHRINVNAIAPGFIETDMVVFEGVHDRETVIKGIPWARLGQPADIGRAAKFLCSEDSDYITGQVIHVNGGLIMY